MNYKPSFSEKMPNYQRHITSFIKQILPKDDSIPKNLHEAIHYTALGEGKRIRPLLMYATGEVLGLPSEALDYPAAAIELIHTYSLVHDDLPAMDDDDLRRGRPTVHKQFNEATAILVGDALLTLAFELLGSCDADPGIKCAWVTSLSRAAGPEGMIAGQIIDLVSENQQLTLDQLEQLHSLKTGALIAASVEMACLADPELPSKSRDQLLAFARGIGLAFQIRDDVIDVESSTELLGKTQGADIEKGKSTYVSLLGLDKAKASADDVFMQACKNLDEFGEEAEPLRCLAAYIVKRNY